MEFLQNAEDAESKEIIFEFTEEYMKIQNDGKNFSPQDVESICSNAVSIKSLQEDKIGEFGIGFKQVFKISDYIEIHSGDYHFKFDKSIQDETRVWMIDPIEIECNNCPIIQLKQQGALFFVRFSKDKVISVNELFEETNKLITQRTPLFLLHTKKIILSFGNQKRELVRNTIKFETQIDMVPNIVEVSNLWNQSLQKEVFLIFSDKIVVDNSFVDDFISRMYNRQKRKTTRLSIAFLVSNKSDHNYENFELLNEIGTLHLSLYSNLIWKEHQLYLPFFLNGDFLIDSGRDNLIESKWNQWLSNVLPTFFINNCIPVLKSHPQWKYNWGAITHKEYYYPQVDILNAIQELGKYIKKSNYLLTIDGREISEDKAIQLDTNLELLSLFKEGILKIEDIRKALDLDNTFDVTHPKCKIIGQVIRFSLGAPSNEIGFDDTTSKLLSSSSHNNKDLFRAIFSNTLDTYRKISSYSPSSINKWRNKKIIPLENGFGSFNDTIYVVNKNLIQKELLFEKLRNRNYKVLNTEVASDENLFDKLVNFSIKPNIKIVNVVSDIYTPPEWLNSIEKKWSELTSQDKIKTVIDIIDNKDMYQGIDHTVAFSFLEVEVLINDISKMVQINNSILIPPIHTKGTDDKKIIKLLSQIDKSRIPVLSGIYFSTNEHNAIEFFKKLGLSFIDSWNIRYKDKPENHIIGLLGQQIVINYLTSKNQGKIVKKVDTIHNVESPFDLNIENPDDQIRRHIEIKSKKGTSTEISFTTKQSKLLSNLEFMKSNTTVFAVIKVLGDYEIYLILGEEIERNAGKNIRYSLNLNDLENKTKIKLNSD